MKLIPKLAIALATLGTCAVVVAQPYSPSDQERRDRNREEVMARHGHMDAHTNNARSDAREGRSNAREEMHEGAHKARAKTHKAAQSTRSFTHRQLDKVRNFGDRQQSRLPANPGTESTNKSPTALGK